MTEHISRSTNLVAELIEHRTQNVAHLDARANRTGPMLVRAYRSGTSSPDEDSVLYRCMGEWTGSLSLPPRTRTRTQEDGRPYRDDIGPPARPYWYIVLVWSWLTSWFTMVSSAWDSDRLSPLRLQHRVLSVHSSFPRRVHRCMLVSRSKWCTCCPPADWQLGLGFARSPEETSCSQGRTPNSRGEQQCHRKQ